MDAPVYLERPPGIEVGLCVDIGHAFLHVSGKMLDDWGVTAEAALQLAMDNVRQRASARKIDPIAFTEVAGVPTAWFQSGASFGSALLLLPDEIVRRFGPASQLLIAPMRDLLISVPEEAGIEFAAEMRDFVAEEDPNCLDLPVFSLVDGRLEIASTPQTGEARTYVH
jgi:hypothetical protein